MFSTVIMFFLYLLRYICCLEIEAENIIERPDDNIFEKIGRLSDTFKNGSSRQSKFLTFNNDASNIRVEAVFAVPILAIPIGGKSASANSAGVTVPKVDINLKSIVSMAGIFLMLFFVIPKVVQTFLPQKLTSHETPNSARGNQLNSITERIDEALNVHNIDIKSCAQKAICWTVNNAATKVKQGKADSVEKLVDAISSFPYLKYVLEDTWLWTLMENVVAHSKNARENGTCQKFGNKCSITQHGLNNAAGSLLAAIKKTKMKDNN